ncbi:MAG: acyl carrier protein [Caldilineaceae bacterium]
MALALDCLALQQIEVRVYAIIAAVLDVDSALVVPTARFREDLGADSLDLAELIVAFGHAFASRIDDSEVRGIVTVGEAVAYIEQALDIE